MISNQPSISLSPEAKSAVWKIFGPGEDPSKRKSSYDLIEPVLKKNVLSANLNSDIREIRSWFDTDQNKHWLKHKWHEPVAKLIIPEIRSKINSEQKETKEIAVWAASAICAKSSLPIIRSDWSSTEMDSFVEVAISVLEKACRKDLVIDVVKLYGKNYKFVKTDISRNSDKTKGTLQTFIHLDRSLKQPELSSCFYPVVFNLISLVAHLQSNHFQEVIKELDYPIVQIHIACQIISTEKDIFYHFNLESIKTLQWITRESCDSVIALAIVSTLNAVKRLNDNTHSVPYLDVDQHSAGTEKSPLQNEHDAVDNTLLHDLVARLFHHLDPQRCTRWIGELLSGAPYILDSFHDHVVPPPIEQLEESCTKLLARLIDQIEWKDFFQELCAGLRLTLRNTWTRHLAALAWEISTKDPARARIVAQATIDQYEQQIKEELQKGEMYISWKNYHDYKWTRGIGICLVLAQPRPDPFTWIVEHCRQSPLSIWDVEENCKAFLTANRAVEHWFLVGLDAVGILDVLGQSCDHQTARKIVELVWSHCHFVRQYLIDDSINSIASKIAARLAVEAAPDDAWLLDIARHPCAGPLVLWAMLHERRCIANHPAKICTHAGDHFEEEVKIIAQQKFHDDDLLDFHSLQYWAELWLLLDATDEAERTAIALTTLSTRQTDRSTNVLILKLLALASTGEQLPESVTNFFQDLYRKTWQHSALDEEQADREMVDRCLRQSSIRIP